MMNHRSALIAALTAVTVLFNLREAVAQPPAGQTPSVELVPGIHCLGWGPTRSGQYTMLVKPSLSNVRSRYSAQYVRVRANFYLTTWFSRRSLVTSSNWWEGVATSDGALIGWRDLTTGRTSLGTPGFSQNLKSAKGYLFSADVDFYWRTPTGTWSPMRVQATGGCRT